MNRPTQHERHQFEQRRGNRLRLLAWMLAGLLTTHCLPGCNGGSSTRSSLKPIQPVTLQSKVIAQGQILPAGGLIRLAASPGDIVEQVPVSVGDAVTAGQTLMTMRSLKLHDARVAALHSRLADVKQQQESAVEQARFRVATTEAKIDQAALQAKALERQEDILKAAEKQVTESERILERLNSIAKDPLTSDFVGMLQIEQQKLAVGEAQLKYRQQEESFQQAKESSEFGTTAAEQEWKAAKLALEIAQKSRALEAIESELEALEIQKQSATIIAPQAAVVVAINTRVGESATQFPLIELADVSKVVCEAEVVETDAALIAPNQLAKISSPALPQELRGKVVRRGQLVGRPQLAIADPLAKADYRSVVVEIEIAPADVSIAAKWLQLQVDVEIDITSDSSEGNSSGDVSGAPATNNIAPNP